MEFLEVLKRRVSVRSYNSQKIEEEKIQKVLEIMRLAPTAGCLEAYKIHIEKTEDGIKALAVAAGQEDSIAGAGCIIVFFADLKGSSWKYGERGRSLYSVQDATLACAYAQLGAAEQGFCSLWVGAFDDAEVGKACGADENLRAVAMLVLGYSDEIAKRPGRKGLDDLIV